MVAKFVEFQIGMFSNVFKMGCDSVKQTADFVAGYLAQFGELFGILKPCQAFESSRLPFDSKSCANDSSRVGDSEAVTRCKVSKFRLLNWTW